MQRASSTILQLLSPVFYTTVSGTAKNLSSSFYQEWMKPMSGFNPLTVVMNSIAIDATCRVLTVAIEADEGDKGGMP